MGKAFICISLLCVEGWRGEQAMLFDISFMLLLPLYKIISRALSIIWLWLSHCPIVLHWWFNMKNGTLNKNISTTIFTCIVSDISRRNKSASTLLWLILKKDQYFWRWYPSPRYLNNTCILNRNEIFNGFNWWLPIWIWDVTFVTWLAVHKLACEVTIKQLMVASASYELCWIIDVHKFKKKALTVRVAKRVKKTDVMQVIYWCLQFIILWRHIEPLHC